MKHEVLQKNYKIPITLHCYSGRSEERIHTLVFEAFNEPWKGSDDPQEREKHWGLFKVDRKPKQVMQQVFS